MVNVDMWMWYAIILETEPGQIIELELLRIHKSNLKQTDHHHI